MSSSEMVVDSGNSGGRKSNFSQTCSLLSQYLKENGSFGELSLGLSSYFQPHGATNLFQQHTSVTNGESEKGQMTLFYGGQVIVLDEFPADKVNEIMTMSEAQNPTIFSMGQKSPKSAINLVTASNFVNNLVHQGSPITRLPIITDLPIERKASLARFFGKRKDRLAAKAPYQTSSTGSTLKPDEGKGAHWRGIGAHPPTKIVHEA